METNQNTELAFFEELSVKEFLDVGMNKIAYIRQVDSTDETAEETFAVYAADGSQISVMDSYDTAIAAIRINDLYPVTLQ